jgi:hypothetical protein
MRKTLKIVYKVFKNPATQMGHNTVVQMQNSMNYLFMFHFKYFGKSLLIYIMKTLNLREFFDFFPIRFCGKFRT